jgi:hypothetical protein
MKMRAVLKVKVLLQVHLQDHLDLALLQEVLDLNLAHLSFLLKGNQRNARKN